jgi:D-alanine-D-alanine ligase
MKKQKVAVVCGGPSREYEVSLNTAQSMLENLNNEKYEVWVFYMSKNKKARLYKYSQEESVIEEAESSIYEELKQLRKFDMCLLATHGEFGEDGKLQGIMEMENIPFTGSDSISSALCMDKFRASLVVDALSEVEIILQDLVLLEKLSDQKLDYPFFIKPNRYGSSVGAYVVKNEEQWSKILKKLKEDFDHKDGFLIQELIDYDHEVSCGCLEINTGELVELPVIEIIPQRESKFFDYEAKYTEGGAKEVCPAELSEETNSYISNLAGEIHKLLGCSVYSRSDFFIKGEKVYYLETNSLPGMTSTSLLPQEAKANGMSFEELLDFIIENGGCIG